MRLLTLSKTLRRFPAMLPQPMPVLQGLRELEAERRKRATWERVTIAYLNRPC